MTISQQVAWQLGNGILRVGDPVIVPLVGDVVDEVYIACHRRSVCVLRGS